MNVQVERDWATRTIKVWFYMRPMSARSIVWLRTDGDTREWVELAEGEITPTPSFVFHEDEVAALLPELTGLLPSSESMANHLKDAVLVRDRLLTLVEKSHP